MKKWTQLTLLSIALAGLGACSSDNKTATSADAQTETSAQASAEAFGYLISITAWGFLIGKVSVHLPLLPTILKLFSASYIIYLAIKLWRTADVEVSFNQPTIRARELFLATLLNPKALNALGFNNVAKNSSRARIVG